MTVEKHYKGQIRRPGQKPENVELVIYDLGFAVEYDPVASSIIGAPAVWVEANQGLAQTPGIGSYFNVILAPGSNADDTVNNNVWRCVVIGEAAGQRIVEWERVEAIGSGCMRFAPYAQRCTAVGTLALQWLGATSQQYLIDTFHDFFIQNDLPGEVGWDFVGLETRNPGIGQDIADFSNFPSSTSTVTQNVAIGRDAALHLVRGIENTACGYQAGAHWFSASENAAFGENALRDGVFINGCTAIGRSAGIHNQEGDRNIFIGREAGENFVKGDRNIFIGGSAGQDYHHDSGHEFSNKFILQMNALGNYLAGDLDKGSLFLALDDNDLANIESLQSGYYNIVSVATAPTTPGRFLGTSTATVSTFNSYTGATETRSHMTVENPNGVVGSITSNGSATAFNTSSDARLKDDLGTDPDSLDTVLSVPVHRYKWKAGGNEETGFFAHELQEAIPYVVTGEPNGEKMQQVDYGRLTATLWRAIQQQQAQIDSLRAEIAELRR